MDVLLFFVNFILITFSLILSVLTLHSSHLIGFGGGGGGGNARQIKYLASGSRALSWCATENSGSQLKLETLFEGQNQFQNVDNDIIAAATAGHNNANSKNVGAINNSIYSGRLLASPLSNAANRTGSNSSINNLLSSANGRTSTPPILANSANAFRNLHNHSSLSNRKTGSVKGGGVSDMPPILPPRSVSVNGIRSRDDIARLAALNRFGEASVEEGAEVMVDTVDDILSRGNLRRSQSENRLHGRVGTGVGGSGGFLNQGSNENTPAVGGSRLQGGPGNQSRQTAGGRSLSRNLSVDRLDRLTARPGAKHKTQHSSSRLGSYTSGNHNSNKGNNNNNAGGIGRLRKVSSMSAMNTNVTNNNNNNNNNTRAQIGNTNISKYKNNNNSSIANRNTRTNKRHDNSHRNSIIDDYDNQDDDTAPEDEENIEASARLVEWLNVVNNIDEYDTDPQHTIVDYADEPPQTDTAVHVVYEG
ncbi:hypothetical protein PoB_002851200 [Plakobranchus ocellatus]|uniref:Uncharacterized protein n=1 Tax=Plakobranchus ocellatus TaxID=259542 RepID=A0AAV4A583_9GAST|nr:hypothetical protein PoB_002851200 [Plakobranchus ocellatus]